MLKNLLAIGIILSAATAQAQTHATQLLLPTGSSSNYPALVTAQFSREQVATVSQLQEMLIQRTASGAWVDYSRNTYLRYRTVSLPGLIRTDRKNGASWVAYIAHRYRYTTAGEILSDTIDQFQVVPYGAYFASAGEFTTPSRLRRDWTTFRTPGNNAAPWDSLYRTNHTYNAAGQHTQLVQQLYSQGKFADAERRLWTYNAKGQITVVERQTAPNGTPDWGTLQRSTYTYNPAGKMQQVITELGLGAPYSNSSRSTVQFDAQGRESVSTTDKWDSNTWKVNSQTIYAYNTTGDLISATSQLWNGSIFVNAERLLFTYQQVLGTQSPATRQPLAIAPNPSSLDAPARLLLEPGTANATGGVYDQLGRQVAALAVTPAQAAHGHLFLPASVPAGLYIVRLQAGTRQFQARWDKR